MTNDLKCNAFPFKIHARLYNYEPLSAIRTIKSSSIGKLVCIRGTSTKDKIKKERILIRYRNCGKSIKYQAYGCVDEIFLY